MIAIPAIRRQADQRWIIRLWRGAPCRARFQYFELDGVWSADLDWDDEWLSAIPEWIPQRLRSRAHRELRRLKREPSATPRERLARINHRRRAMAQQVRPRLVQP